MNRKALSTLDDFNYWVADMDDALERFFAVLPPEVREKLDYTPASLDTLEGWLLQDYATPQELLAPDQTAKLDGAARYFGETFRKTLGGYWDIDLDNPKNVYFGVPVVTGYNERPTPIAPIRMVPTALHHRTGEFLRTLVQNYQEGLLRKKP
jgi:hypothetical protein